MVSAYTKTVTLLVKDGLLISSSVPEMIASTISLKASLRSIPVQLWALATLPRRKLAEKMVENRILAGGD